jgi:hypothetical protein
MKTFPLQEPFEIYQSECDYPAYPGTITPFEMFSFSTSWITKMLSFDSLMGYDGFL